MIRPPLPCAIIALPAARARKNAALRLMSCWKSQSSSVTSSRLAPPPEHRGEVRQARRGCRAPRAPGATSASWLPMSPRLAAMPTWPLPSKPATTSSTFAWSRSTASTLAPVVANASATALPMPPAAPVTMTPLPSRPAPTLQAHRCPPGPSCPVRGAVLAQRSARYLLAAVSVDDLFDDLDARGPASWAGSTSRPRCPIGSVTSSCCIGFSSGLTSTQLERRGGEAHGEAGGGQMADDQQWAFAWRRWNSTRSTAFIDPVMPSARPGSMPTTSTVPVREDPLEPVDVPLLLAVRDERRRLAAQVRVALGIPGAERLLDPVEVVLLECLARAGRPS